MDRLHTEMVRQLEQSEDMEETMEVKPKRKMSVSTACQTEKVSRKVSHVARLKESPPARPVPSTETQEMSREMSQEMSQEMSRETSQEMMTPVTRATSSNATERSELTGVVKLREESIINAFYNFRRISLGEV